MKFLNNNINNIKKSIIFSIILLSGIIVSVNFFICREIPSVFYSEEKAEINLGNVFQILPIKIVPNSNLDSVEANSKFDTKNSYKANVTLFNIPLKKVTVQIYERPKVFVSGIPYVIKIFMNGVMVVNTTSVSTQNGEINPAQECGIKSGDLITQANGTAINTNEDFAYMVENCSGILNLTISRKNYCFPVNLFPAKTSDNKYRAGLWIRDSSAGIGTMTFFDKNTHQFASLGHGIRDIDTEELIPLAYGDILEAKINSVIKSVNGLAGELRGSVSNDKPIGELKLNDNSGVYGNYNETANSTKPNNLSEVEIAFKQEITRGPATMISTINGTIPKSYNINVDAIKLNKSDSTKNIVISVTDEELLQNTGGIVQGMSGSPIVQGNKLVGAVTHVCVNNPVKGYGILAETMMKNLQSTKK
ncbi:MAG: SpoIVB peptidase [Candidatus Improbicoccus devescovinae]|nr:MAG: SpoIVB peptidase [Candidatus Improbicoccus devescovinae]